MAAGAVASREVAKRRSMHIDQHGIVQSTKARVETVGAHRPRKDYRIDQRAANAGTTPHRPTQIANSRYPSTNAALANADLTPHQPMQAQHRISQRSTIAHKVRGIRLSAPTQYHNIRKRLRP